MNEEYLVLGLKAYDFDNKDGENVSGVNVYYLDLLMNDYDSSVRGYMPLKTSATPRVLEQLKVLPGIYDLTFRQKPGAGGKPTLVLADARFVGAANFIKEQAAK